MILRMNIDLHAAYFLYVLSNQPYFQNFEHFILHPLDVGVELEPNVDFSDTTIFVVSTPKFTEILK